KNKKITIFGASYRRDIDDSRNSPTIMLYDDIKRAGAIPQIHDPYTKIILNRKDIKITSNLDSALDGASGVIFAVKHREYEDLPMKKVISKVNNNGCIIDAFDVLTNEKIVRLKNNGFKVLGVGKGHIKYL
ncbi:MAG: hypothetical protein IMZ60_02055, partial [Actinobacteria bacterium]|nr:hypothetical protein [Actinomycetota bacterium]